MGDPLSDLPARARTRGSSLTDTEEGRTFFGQRLSVLGLCIFALSGGFQVVQSVLFIVLLWGNVPILTRGGLLGSAALLQLGATATAGLLWWLTRRRSLPASWCRVVRGCAKLARGAAARGRVVVGNCVARGMLRVAA